MENRVIFWVSTECPTKMGSTGFHAPSPPLNLSARAPMEPTHVPVGKLVASPVVADRACQFSVTRRFPSSCFLVPSMLVEIKIGRLAYGALIESSCDCCTWKVFPASPSRRTMNGCVYILFNILYRTVVM